MSYTVRAEWDDTGWWVITVPDVPGAVSQARRLDQVRDDAVEIIKLQTGETVDPAALNVEWELPGRVGDLASEARGMRASVDAYTREAVHELRRLGFSLRDVGEMVGLSFQRVQQIERRAEPANKPASRSAKERREVNC